MNDYRSLRESRVDRKRCTRLRRHLRRHLRPRPRPRLEFHPGQASLRVQWY